MLEEIIRLYSEVKGIYGYRRMTLNVNSLAQRNYNHKLDLPPGEKCTYAGRDTPKEEALCHVGTAHYLLKTY